MSALHLLNYFLVEKSKQLGRYKNLDDLATFRRFLFLLNILRPGIFQLSFSG